MRGGPPADILPERLFRLLLERPRPTAPIRWRSAVLCVRALTGLEEQSCYDAAAGIESPEAFRSVVSVHMVAAAVVLRDGTTAFEDAEAVGRMPGVHADALAAEVRKVLERISPSYLRSDLGAWVDVLKKGAKHPTNMATVRALGASVDLALGYGVRGTIERPDRYFGVPFAELTDGAWMAFRVARLVLVEAQNAA